MGSVDEASVDDSVDQYSVPEESVPSVDEASVPSVDEESVPSVDEESVPSADDDSVDGESVDGESVDGESVDGESVDEESIDEESVPSVDEESVPSVVEESIPAEDDDTEDDDSADPNGVNVHISGQTTQAKSTLSLEDDIQRDISAVLGIPMSSVDVLSVSTSGSRYTAIVRLLDSSISATDAATELRRLEASNDPILENTVLSQATVEIVDNSVSEADFDDDSSASFLMASVVLGAIALLA